MPHLPDDRLTLVRRLYETSEMTIAEIAVLADVSESAIYQRARRERWTNWRRPGVTPRRAKPRPPLAPTPALLALGHGRDADCRDPGRIEDAETGEAGATPHDRAPLDRNPLDRAATARRLWLAVDRHLADLETYGGPEGMIRAAQNLATLARTLETGAYEMRGVAATTSPSMDIQISSNFERLLFEAHGRDGAAVRRLMQSLVQSGRFEIAPEPLARIRSEFDALAVDEAATSAEIDRTWREAGYLLDPHTAVGVAAGRAGLKRDPATPMVVLGTAHPAKFPAAVAAASGVTPTLPPHLADLMERRERTIVLPADQGKLEALIRERARLLRGAAA